MNHEINEEILDKEIRVIGDDGEQLGIMSAEAAMKIAEEKELDLVKISPMAKPPVCKIMDYGKYRFEQSKREKEAKKNQRVMEVKEIRMSPGIGENDWSIRKAFCDCFEWLGVRIDNNKNREAVGNGPQVISAAGSSVTVMVIPTDEEYMIAHDVERLTKNN